MKTNLRLEFIENKLPNWLQKQFTLTGKKIYANNLKAGQYVVAYVEKTTASKKATIQPSCIYLEILGFTDSWALDKSVLKKVKQHFKYFESPPIDEDEVCYSSVREYKSEYDTSGLSDEAFQNAVYEEPILYAKKLNLLSQKQVTKPYILLRATENERLEWHDKGLITWFELKKVIN